MRARENFQDENKSTRLSMGDHVFPYKAVCTDGTNTEYFKTFRANGPFSHSAVLPEKEKENVPPLPRGFIRASDYPRDDDTFGFPQNGTNRKTSRFTSEERDTDQNFTQSEPTPSKMGQKVLLVEREEISDCESQAQTRHEKDSHQLRGGSRPLRDITASYKERNPFATHQQQEIFGSARSTHSKYHDPDSLPDTSNSVKQAPPTPSRDTMSTYMPLVPYRSYRQETHDDDDIQENERRSGSRHQSTPQGDHNDNEGFRSL